ncbi:hypothetical protein B0O80DRAFT_499737 [Mortierella sp. GBAus27b]|nr:hypothetical protein B0O80DRAFT_503700 [Mortierella sp. GBAus27b]KAI8352440.1 hypothetical protein B0O80DRAFT_499737 [Mortierella sp. GBAus27b]
MVTDPVSRVIAAFQIHGVDIDHVWCSSSVSTTSHGTLVSTTIFTLPNKHRSTGSAKAGKLFHVQDKASFPKRKIPDYVLPINHAFLSQYEPWKTGRYKSYTPKELVDIVARIFVLVSL